MTRSLRLLVWPILLTFVVSLLRLSLEVNGTVPAATGGRMHPLGISWLVFVFGGYFGWKVGGGGRGPTLRPALLWSLLALAAIVGTVVWRLSAVDPDDRSATAFESLRTSVLIVVSVGGVAMVLGFAIWRRVALLLLLYGVASRGAVLLLTWLAKTKGWDTHYTKFGPAGIERPLAETMTSATLAQLGIWVPFTVAGGLVAASVTGALAAGLRSRRTVPSP